ncbi:endonuclease NucS [Methanobacterium petrolearium]|uniref:endonuclease NucS n=1 Tax=Methanobacterium petrolearium TaxID=710190 RepID=UPI001AE1BF78|nr:endonuclease NucS [Methanobacterium petrolearium]MBP1946261.1 RecB family endonuclease NucS [Methanobacterium petrolearium]
MKLVEEKNPDAERVLEIIIEGISKRAFITIMASCRVYYEGRATSRLELGDRIILIKSDGSFIIHQDRNLEPVNWQPPKTKVTANIHQGMVKLKGVRRNPSELLEVEILQTHLASYFIGEDSENLELAGYEADMGDLIFKDPEVIEKGFRPTSREYHTPQGFIDIMGKDQDGNITILELKSRKAGTNAVKQLRRYVDCFCDHKEKVRGVLVAPSATDDALEMLEEQGMEFKALEAPRELKNNKVVTLESFFSSSSS